MAKWIVVALACLFVLEVAAQDGLNPRAFCDPDEPRNQCPGASCNCTEDVLGLRFEPGGSSVLELEDLEPGLLLDAVVDLETRSTGVQGWSYGVRHDGRALTIESVTTDGTDAGIHFFQGFNATRLENIMDCTSDPNPRCSNPQPGTGFISATVLSLTRSAALPVGTNSLARATYRLEPAAAEVGEAGIFLDFTDRLAVRNSPPTAINITINGRSTQPITIIDGRIFVSVEGSSFHRGDPDGDGRLSVADAVALLLFLFLAGPSPGCLESGDFDDDGRIDATDPVLILRWLFLGGSAPAPPGPPAAPCGPDPEGSRPSLGCDDYAGC